MQNIRFSSYSVWAVHTYNMTQSLLKASSVMQCGECNNMKNNTESDWSDYSYRI